MKQFFLQKGVAFYVATSGLGFFSPWMFIVYCFVYAYQGIELSISKLLTVLLMSIIAGLFWGGTSWFLFARQKPRHS